MKIRNGFVSNSSSSSFVLRGFVIDEKDFDYKKMGRLITSGYDEMWEEYVEEYGEDAEEYDFFLESIDNSDIHVGFGTEGGAPSEDKVIVGELFATDTDECFSYEEIDLVMSEQLQEIKDAFDIKDDLKVIIGRMLT